MRKKLERRWEGGGEVDGLLACVFFGIDSMMDRRVAGGDEWNEMRGLTFFDNDNPRRKEGWLKSIPRKPFLIYC